MNRYLFTSHMFEGETKYTLYLVSDVSWVLPELRHLVVVEVLKEIISVSDLFPGIPKDHFNYMFLPHTYEGLYYSPDVDGMKGRTVVVYGPAWCDFIMEFETDEAAKLYYELRNEL